MTTSRTTRETRPIVDDRRARLNPLGNGSGGSATWSSCRTMARKRSNASAARASGAAELRSTRESVDLPVMMFTGRGNPLAAVEGRVSQPAVASTRSATKGLVWRSMPNCPGSP
jgi:hypothetical protein